MRSRAVAWWHASLRAVAVLNIVLWSLAAVAVARSRTSVPLAADVGGDLQLLLSAGYVAGCAFRSFLPVIDIPRIVLVDSPLSRVSVGRSVATVAELCFAAQWALMLQPIASAARSPFVQAVSLAILPLIVLAEGCSWYAVLTTRQRPHAAENSLWGLSAALVVAALLAVGPGRSAVFYALVVAGGVLYAAFIFAYDVPMYWARWRIDETGGRRYLSVARGWADVHRRGTVSYRWEDWKDELPWMSLYFTFGVWSSIALAYASAVRAGD
ncbi:MAG: hypothetical protein KGJ68_04435 [Gammaproteobacteria bacterium]|nr:hypothetical protein [Gammaproteobacteria bacterium]